MRDLKYNIENLAKTSALAVGRLVIFLGVALVVFFTLSPFKFTLEATPLSWDLLALSPGKEIDWEIVVNILLYLPLGFGIAKHYRSNRLSRLEVFAVSLLSCFVLSYCCEVLQSFLPRFPSWRDVGSNTLGGILGCLGLFVLETKNISLFLLGYLVTVSLASIPVQSATTLKNWNPAYMLLVGNERTANRPWRGTVSEFYIADRAANAQEIREIVARKNAGLSLSGSMVAYYIRNSSGYLDQIGNSPALVARSNGSDQSTRPEQSWFESLEPTSHLTNALARSSQFTLGATIVSQDSNQSGPARIISLSFDPSLRNFTLGQAGQDLVFRLRTPHTGENGSNPELRVPSVFSTSKELHIVVTYDAKNLLVYIDGLLSSHSLELTPGLVAYTFLSGTYLPRSPAADLIYYGILFLPIGVMLLLALRELKLHSNLGVVSLGGIGLFIVSLLLEGVLAYLSGRHMRVENIFLGMFYSYFSFLGMHTLANRLPMFTQAVS